MYNLIEFYTSKKTGLFYVWAAKRLAQSGSSLAGSMADQSLVDQTLVDRPLDPKLDAGQSIIVIDSDDESGSDTKPASDTEPPAKRRRMSAINGVILDDSDDDDDDGQPVTTVRRHVRSHFRSAMAEIAAYADEPKVFAWVGPVDYGYVPNLGPPSATMGGCKPGVRMRAQPKDVLVCMGQTTNVLTPQHRHILWMAEVIEKIHISDYYHDARFVGKRAEYQPGYSDNNYMCVPKGTRGATIGPDGFYYIQLMAHQNLKWHFHNDLRGNNVLVLRIAYYGARTPLEIPAELDAVKAVRDAMRVKERATHVYLKRDNPDLYDSVLHYVHTHEGVHGLPRDCNEHAAGNIVEWYPHLLTRIT